MALILRNFTHSILGHVLVIAGNTGQNSSRSRLTHLAVVIESRNISTNQQASNEALLVQHKVLFKRKHILSKIERHSVQKLLLYCTKSSREGKRPNV